MSESPKRGRSKGSKNKQRSKPMGWNLKDAHSRCEYARQLIKRKTKDGTRILSKTSTKALQDVAETLCKQYATDLEQGTDTKKSETRAYAKRLRQAVATPADLREVKKAKKMAKEEYKRINPNKTPRSTVWIDYINAKMPALQAKYKTQLAQKSMTRKDLISLLSKIYQADKSRGYDPFTSLPPAPTTPPKY